MRCKFVHEKGLSGVRPAMREDLHPSPFASRQNPVLLRPGTAGGDSRSWLDEQQQIMWPPCDVATIGGNHYPTNHSVLYRHHGRYDNYYDLWLSRQQYYYQQDFMRYSQQQQIHEQHTYSWLRPQQHHESTSALQFLQQSHEQFNSWLRPQPYPEPAGFMQLLHQPFDEQFYYSLFQSYPHVTNPMQIYQQESSEQFDSRMSQPKHCPGSNAHFGQPAGYEQSGFRISQPNSRPTENAPFPQQESNYQSNAEFTRRNNCPTNCTNNRKQDRRVHFDDVPRGDNSSPSLKEKKGTGHHHSPQKNTDQIEIDFLLSPGATPPSSNLVKYPTPLSELSARTVFNAITNILEDEKCSGLTLYYPQELYNKFHEFFLHGGDRPSRLYCQQQALSEEYS